MLCCIIHFEKKVEEEEEEEEEEEGEDEGEWPVEWRHEASTFDGLCDRETPI